MTEFEINEQTYRIGKLNAFVQFHISRRIAPIIPTLIPIFVKISKDGSVTKDVSGLAEVMTPFAEGIAQMSDESSEYVLSHCLSIVQRKHNGNWTPVWSAQNKVCMFEDMDLGVLIQVTMKVIQDSLAPFISGLLTSQASSPDSPQIG